MRDYLIGDGKWKSRLRYFMARCALWKRAAKKWRAKSFEWQRAYTKSSGEEIRLSGKWAEAEATATNRKKFLIQCNNIMPVCPECGENLKTWENLAENKTIRVGHARGCKFDEELKDE